MTNSLDVAMYTHLVEAGYAAGDVFKDEYMKATVFRPASRITVSKKMNACVLIGVFRAVSEPFT